MLQFTPWAGLVVTDRGLVVTVAGRVRFHTINWFNNYNNLFFLLQPAYQINTLINKYINK